MEPLSQPAHTNKYQKINNLNTEMEKLRLFLKHLSYIYEHSKDNYNLTKSVIAEIESFTVDNSLHCLELNGVGSFYSNIVKQIEYLHLIIDGFRDKIMNRYHIQRIREYRPFNNYSDEKEFEQIFLSLICINVPFNIHYHIALYAVGRIKRCYNPHKIDKELLILNGNENKEWFLCDYPLNAVVCSKCFAKYGKQCHGCKQIVLSNAINSVTMDGKWYCTQSVKCMFGFGDDYIHPNWYSFF